MGKSIVLSKPVSFDGSPLGKVVFKKPINERVNDIIAVYKNVVSLSRHDEIALRTLVTTFIINDIWDKLIGVYPMIGNTVQKQSINLVNVNEFNLSVYEHGSAIDKGINFATPEDYSQLSIPEVIKKPVLNTAGITSFVFCDRIGAGNAALAAAIWSKPNLEISVTTINPKQNLGFRVGSDMQRLNLSDGNAGMISMYQDVSNIAYGINTDGVLTNIDRNVISGKGNITNVIGGTSDESATLSSSNTWRGNIYAYAIAVLSDINEYKIFDKAMRRFCNSVKKQSK